MATASGKLHGFAMGTHVGLFQGDTVKEKLEQVWVKLIEAGNVVVAAGADPKEGITLEASPLLAEWMQWGDGVTWKGWVHRSDGNAWRLHVHGDLPADTVRFTSEKADATLYIMGLDAVLKDGEVKAVDWDEFGKEMDRMAMARQPTHQAPTDGESVTAYGIHPHPHGI